MKPPIFCLALLLLAATSARADDAAVQRAASFDQRLGAAVPLDAVFLDESARPLPLGHLLGQRPAILLLGYHECPMLCSLILGELTKSLNDLRLTTGQDFDLIDISISPADTPALAAQQKRIYFKRYARPGADAGWHFLTTPDDATVRRLADAVGFRYAFDPATKQYAHPSGIVILTPDGKVSRYLFGVSFDPGDLQSALRAASRREVGSPVQRLLLTCFHYNPITGKYGPLIMTALRAAGLLTLLAIGGGILFLIRRERTLTHI